MHTNTQSKIHKMVVTAMPVSYTHLVEYDDSALNSGAISAAVSAAGYGAQPTLQRSAAAAVRETPQVRNQAELNQMKHRLLWSIAFLLPLFYISMGHMLGLRCV